MTTISDGTTELHPILWMNYKTTRAANTTAHPLMGGNVAITLAPPEPRRAAVALLFDDEDASKACEDMHATPGVITITEEGRDTHSMQYVVIGTIGRELDPESAAIWVVTAEVIEVGV